MKFACIEYTSKSGGIWRPTPKRPNYLADHKREIDATSYGGTWTSALGGEHIPLSWFINGKRGPGAGERFSLPLLVQMKLNRRLGRPLVQFRNLDYLKNFDVVLVCYHPAGYRLMTQFMVEAKQRFPDIVFLGTHAVFGIGYLREHWKDSPWFRSFGTFLDLSDVFVVAIPDEPAYLSLVSNTPIVYVPQFYPVSYARKYYRTHEAKDGIIFVAGNTSRTDTVWGCLLARELHRRFPQYTIQAVGSSSFNTEPLAGSRYQLLSAMNWEDYLAVTSRAKLIINTDVLWTNGRVQADAAVVGTPCIGVNAGRQTELFPDLACHDVVDTPRILELGARLIQDAPYYEQVTTKAFAMLEQWSYEKAPGKLEELVASYPTGRLGPASGRKSVAVPGSAVVSKPEGTHER